MSSIQSVKLEEASNEELFKLIESAASILKKREVSNSQALEEVDQKEETSRDVKEEFGRKRCGKGPHKHHRGFPHRPHHHHGHDDEYPERDFFKFGIPHPDAFKGHHGPHGPHPFSHLPPPPPPPFHEFRSYFEGRDIYPGGPHHPHDFEYGSFPPPPPPHPFGPQGHPHHEYRGFERGRHHHHPPPPPPPPHSHRQGCHGFPGGPPPPPDFLGYGRDLSRDSDERDFDELRAEFWRKMRFPRSFGRERKESEFEDNKEEMTDVSTPPSDIEK